MVVHFCLRTVRRDASSRLAVSGPQWAVASEIFSIMWEIKAIYKLQLLKWICQYIFHYGRQFQVYFHIKNSETLKTCQSSIFLNIMFHAPMGSFQLQLIYYSTYFSLWSLLTFVCFFPVGLSLLIQYFQHVISFYCLLAWAVERNTQILDGTTVEK